MSILENTRLRCVNSRVNSNGMWSDDDITAHESWYEAHSGYCTECGERWLRDQMVDRLGALYCPDCITEQPRVSPVRAACMEEVRRMRKEADDVNVALCGYVHYQAILNQRTTQVGR